MNAQRGQAVASIVRNISYAETLATDDETIEKAVSDLNAICRSATLGFALAVGKFVIDRFYAGDLDRWRSRDPVRRNSLRKLARHPDLAMSAGSLYRSVAMYELAQRIGIRRCRRVSTSHLRLVLPLLPAEQERLMRETEEVGWSVRRLEEEVRLLTQREPRSRTARGGRRPHSTLSRAIRVVEDCARVLNEFLAAHDDGDAPSPEIGRAAIEALRAATEACTRVERRLAPNLVAGRSTPPPAIGMDIG
jgi:hypothetical protein